MQVSGLGVTDSKSSDVDESFAGGEDLPAMGSAFSVEIRAELGCPFHPGQSLDGGGSGSHVHRGDLDGDWLDDDRFAGVGRIDGGDVYWLSHCKSPGNLRRSGP